MENNHNDILKSIREKGITVKPKAYFVLKAILAGLGIFALFIFVIYLISFTVFSLRASGVWFLPKFGLLGYQMLFGNLPWLLILLCIGLVVALEMSAEHFAFVYRRPLAYSLGGIVLAVLLGGFALDVLNLHPVVFKVAESDASMPIVRQLYKGYALPQIQQMQHGMVEVVTDTGFVIETPRDEMLTILVDNESIYPKAAVIMEGDTIIALGSRTGNTIKAYAVRKVDGDIDIFPTSRGLRFQVPAQKMK